MPVRARARERQGERELSQLFKKSSLRSCLEASEERFSEQEVLLAQVAQVEGSRPKLQHDTFQLTDHDVIRRNEKIVCPIDGGTQVWMVGWMGGCMDG